jgi:DNA topoisomerase-1
MPDEPILGYCVKCRQKQAIPAPEYVFLGDQNRPATRGTCPVCGTAITRFGRTRAHDELDPQKHTVASKATLQRLATGPKMVIVEASVGHIRDLPSNRMGVDIEHDFAPRYVIPAKKKEVVKKLRGQAKKASEVYLATDPDREGEAIAWHLEAALERELRGIPVRRVEFHEITQQAIGHSFAHPREIDYLRVDAQQARRILDRVVGYTLSPLLRDKMGRRGLSAGRVQSVALRLICEREREIEAFVPVEYWTIEAELSKREASPAIRAPAESSTGEQDGPAPPGSFVARLAKIRGRDPDLKNEDDAQAVVDDLQGAVYTVHKVTRRERRRKPAPPFTTSTLQQEASRKLGFTAKRTMAVAQALYEGKDVGGGERVGLITYMRTDSFRVADEALGECRASSYWSATAKPMHPPAHRSTRLEPRVHRKPTRRSVPRAYGANPVRSSNT